VKSLKSELPLPGNVCSFDDFCASNVSFDTVRMNGSTEYTWARFD
jgi:hypothetical protein